MYHDVDLPLLIILSFSERRESPFTDPSIPYDPASQVWMVKERASIRGVRGRNFREPLPGF